MSISIGDKPIQTLNVGGTSITEVYVGAQKVWAATPPAPFTMVVETTGPDEQVSMKGTSGQAYSGEIDWGDGTVLAFAAYDDPNLTHTYATAGEHTINITGQYEKFIASSQINKDVYKRVENMGDVGWANLDSMFETAQGLESLVFGTCDLSNCNTMTSMFRDANTITDITFGDADFSGIEFASNFCYDCHVSTWDIENLNFSSTLASVGSFLREGGFITGVLDLSHWDTSGVISLARMFRSAAGITEVNTTGWDTGNVTTLIEMFRFTNVLTSVIGIDQWDLSGITGSGLGSNFMSSGRITTPQYDGFLRQCRLAAEAGIPTQTLGMASSQYSATGQAERDTLTGTHGWTITDGGLAP